MEVNKPGGPVAPTAPVHFFQSLYWSAGVYSSITRAICIPAKSNVFVCCTGIRFDFRVGSCFRTRSSMFNVQA